MRGNNNRKIGEIISKLMKNPKLVKKLDKLDALEAWEKIIGAPLYKYITDQKIYNGILYVKTKSSVVRNELNYKKSDLISKINQKIGKELITDIILK
tara:strand:+ start:352 stop:642 length:291 start_codon:yes stop_codon:yes gene_type:complete